MEQTHAVVVGILDPPDAPATNLTVSWSSKMRVGVIEDMGLFPGTIKFRGEGVYPKKLLWPGDEKSSIWLL